MKTHGKGFSEANLRNMRQFYIEYRTPGDDPIRYTVSSELDTPEFSGNLGWATFKSVKLNEHLTTVMKFHLPEGENR